MCGMCDVCVLCEELFLSLMSFVSDRRFPSLLRNQRPGVQKKEHSLLRKKSAKVLFFAERNSRVAFLVLLSRVASLTHYGKPRSTHKSRLSLYTKNGQNTFIWRARRERSNARFARSSVGVVVIVVAARRRL